MVETETATLGGGCFWCLEAVYEQLQGVQKVVNGYAGGGREAPTYEQVCEGSTGHAEVVQVSFDPAIVSYSRLLEIFFSIHDPTTPNRQGADVGTQYRSIILAHSAEQRRQADTAVNEAAGLWKGPIVTQVADLKKFYPAEAYHQGYYRRNPGQGYCQAVVAPKVAKFRQRWAPLLRDANPVHKAMKKP